jgi:hypothetical protein
MKDVSKGTTSQPPLRFPVGLVNRLPRLGFREFHGLGELYVRISWIKKGKNPEAERFLVEIISPLTSKLWPEEDEGGYCDIWKWWNNPSSREFVRKLLTNSDNLRYAADVDQKFIINGMGMVIQKSSKLRRIA